MDNKIKSDLEKAKTLFYSWRLLESYNIFRRYYDRLPFKPEPEHAQYIGMFIRVMLELGKEWELKFYMTELDKLYSRYHTPEVGYQLAHIYMLSKDRNLKTARELLQGLLNQPEAKPYRARIRVSLAYCYDVLDADLAAVKSLIEGISEAQAPDVERVVEIWRAKVLQDNGSFDEAEQKLTTLIEQTPPEVDWYNYFGAMHMLGQNYLDRDKIEEATKVLEKLKKVFEKHQFKSVQSNLDRFEKMIREKNCVGSVQLDKTDDEFKLSYRNKILKITLASLPEKLLVLLLKKKSVNKEVIVKSLYQREYRGEKDDKLIYYHIHSLRKLLSQIGIPSDAIECQGSLYSFLPQIDLTEAGA